MSFLFWTTKIKKTPIFIQMEAAECGAASLAMILGYFGKYIPLEELRIRCNVSRDGSNALKLLDVANDLGLQGEGFEYSIEELRNLDCPVILFWGFNHFLVLEGFKGKKIFLNDPAFGRRRVDEREFKEQFTGKALVFSPKSDFRKEGAPPGLSREIFKRLKQVPVPLFFLILCGVLLLFPGFMIPAFARFFIDNMLGMFYLNWVWAFLFFMIFTILLIFVLTVLQGYILIRLNVKLSLRYSFEFLWHMLRLPISFYQHRFSYELIFRTNLNDRIATLLTGVLTMSFIDLSLVFFYIAVFFQYSRAIGIAAIALALLIIGILSVIRFVQKNHSIRMQQEQSRVVWTSMEMVQRIETIKASAIEENFFTKLGGYYANSINLGQQTAKKETLLNTFHASLHFVRMILFFSIGAVEIIRGELTIGMLVALQLLLLNFFAPIARFVTLNETFQELRSHFKSLNDILKTEKDSIYSIKAPSNSVTRLTGHLEFKNVSFAYHSLDDSPLIQNLSFSILPGMKVALVGCSGCGKSTVAKLAQGLLKPWSGEILYDGKRREEIDLETFRHFCAAVDQDPFFFEGTIQENLSFWNPTIEEDVLIEACRRAAVHEKILSRDTRGYEAPLLEMGKNLSGGEKYRLEIARALLFLPSLLILDGGSEDLDSELQHVIIKNIHRIGCSCLIITNRVDMIQNCDQVLVLDEGRIVQQGTDETLRKEIGIYREIL